MRRLYLLLGDPVAHSRSPAIHSRAFALLGVDAVYAPSRVEPEKLRDAIDSLRTLGVTGCNVTVPHKEAVLPLLDRLDQRAQIIGAVNCIARSEAQGFLTGYNTDVAGVIGALRGAGVEPAGLHAVVLGAGGSARAAAVALAPTASRVTILNRTEAHARDLAATLRDAACLADVGPLQGPEARRVLARADLVVNCTTVGMGTREMPFDPKLLPEGAAVLDLVYAGPRGSAAGSTALLNASRAHGHLAIDGLYVLVHQAIASLEVWLDRPHLAEIKLEGGRSLVSELRAAALAAEVDL